MYPPIHKHCNECGGRLTYDQETGVCTGCEICGLMPPCTIPISKIVEHLTGVLSISVIQEQFSERIRIYFHNGISLSIIRGWGTYGNESGMFEIAIFGPHDNWLPKLFDEDDQGDHVCGYCSLDKVIHYAMKLDGIPDDGRVLP